MMGLFKRAEAVSPTSPAALLAKSLTEPETRGEWERTHRSGFRSLITTYRNKRRDLEVSRMLSISLHSSRIIVSTPFTLSAPEERVVREALRAFDKHQSDERERDALARLVAKGKGK